MPIECRRHQPGLHLRLEALRSHQQNSRAQQALTEYEIAKVFVSGEQYAIGFPASNQYVMVVDSWDRLSDIHDIMAICAKPIDNLFVDILVRDDLHART